MVTGTEHFHWLGLLVVLFCPNENAMASSRRLRGSFASCRPERSEKETGTKLARANTSEGGGGVDDCGNSGVRGCFVVWRHENEKKVKGKENGSWDRKF